MASAASIRRSLLGFDPTVLTPFGRTSLGLTSARAFPKFSIKAVTLVGLRALASQDGGGLKCQQWAEHDGEASNHGRGGERNTLPEYPRQRPGGNVGNAQDYQGQQCAKGNELPTGALPRDDHGRGGQQAGRKEQILEQLQRSGRAQWG